MEILLPEFRQLLLLLKKHHVDFMVVGGYAVIFYGYSRATTDIDILLKPDNQNRTKLIAALTEFGISGKSLDQLKVTDFTGIQFFYFGKKPGKIDFLTRISGVKFDEAELQVNHFVLEKQKIPVIPYQYLILSKITTDRIQDKADIDMLQKIREKRKK
jgi:hypothetical protein